MVCFWLGGEGWWFLIEIWVNVVGVVNEAFELLHGNYRVR